MSLPSEREQEEAMNTMLLSKMPKDARELYESTMQLQELRGRVSMIKEVQASADARREVLARIW